MRILIHSHLFPNDVNPVLGNFVLFFSQALIKLGHAVTIIAPIPCVPPGIKKNSSWYRYKNVPFFHYLEDLKIYHPRFLSIPRRFLFFLRGEFIFLSAWPLYKKILTTKKYDIIHCHVALPDGVVGLYLSKKFLIPYGITIHGADIYESIPENSFNYRKIKKVIENASFLGLVSHKLYDLIIKNKINLNNQTTRIIYNGINIPSIIPEINSPLFTEKKVKLLSVGLLTERKGIQYVLKALAFLKNQYQNLHYYIIGDGKDSEFLKNLAHQYEVDDITTFLGSKSNVEVFGYMNKSDIFVLPSWNESFGIVFIEAMSQGMITVGTKDEGINDIIKDGFNGFLVKPKNVEDLYNKLNFIIKNLEKLENIRENARDTVLSKFTWENNAKKYIELYNKID